MIVLRTLFQLVLIVLLAVVVGVMRLFGGAREKPFGERKHWALALAQPMVDAVDLHGFFDARSIPMDESKRAQLRTALLHQLEWRNDLDDEGIRSHLPQALEGRWFRTDLHGLLPTDAPRDAIAFACVRVAFAARCAALMGWVDEPVCWRVLLLNAQRAQDCFDSWEDFAGAYARGRRQWIAALRADPLGKGLGEKELKQGLIAPGGPWSELPWPGLKAFEPQAIEAA